MSRDFNYAYLEEQGIHCYHLFTEKFKTNSLKCMLPLPLGLQSTANALLPFVLYRGNSRHTETLDLARSLEMLYGTDLHVDVRKRGEWQMVEYSLETVTQQYLPQGETVLPQSLQTLSEILFSPYLPGGNFAEKYVDGEKRTLIEEIKSLKNNKMEYAMERCFQEMCRGEPYSMYRYGEEEELQNITSAALYGHYKKVWRCLPLYIFFVGPVPFSEILSMLQDLFPLRQVDEKRLEGSSCKGERERKIIVEEDKISQGKLIMGYRTDITRASPYYPHLLVANGLLGGFPHSRLFRKVREEKGLAYYVFSRLESTKGLLAISAGIEDSHLDETVSIIDEQLDLLEKGEILQEELEYTKKSLISQFQIAEDDGFDLINLALLGVINENPQTRIELIEDVAHTSIGDVASILQHVYRDTVYFLQPVQGETA